MIGCSGVIVFTNDLKQTCLVSTKRKGNLGFPKGKRHGQGYSKEYSRGLMNPLGQGYSKEYSRGLKNPLGQRYSKEYSRGESYLETAFRELEEETGINEAYIDLVKSKDKNKEKDKEKDDFTFIDELSRKGNPCVKYFIGILKEDYNDHKLTFDENELSKVEWFDVEKVKDLDMLRDNRKDIFEQALNKAKINS